MDKIAHMLSEYYYEIGVFGESQPLPADEEIAQQIRQQIGRELIEKIGAMEASVYLEISKVCQLGEE